VRRRDGRYFPRIRARKAFLAVTATLQFDATALSDRTMRPEVFLWPRAQATLTPVQSSLPTVCSHNHERDCFQQRAFLWLKGLSFPSHRVKLQWQSQWRLYSFQRPWLQVSRQALVKNSEVSVRPYIWTRKRIRLRNVVSEENSIPLTYIVSRISAKLIGLSVWITSIATNLEKLCHTAIRNVSNKNTNLTPSDLRLRDIMLKQSL
jgi:hypothetical protein